MLQRVFPAAYVQRIAVREEGPAAQGLDIIGHHPGIIRPQEGEVPISPK